MPLDIELRPQNNANRYKRLKFHDISAGGIGLIVKASSVFTEGMHVNLTLNFDNRDSVKAIGEIVHITSLNSNSRDFLVGVKYVQIDKASLETLMSFIQEQVVLEYKATRPRLMLKAQDYSAAMKQTRCLCGLYTKSVKFPLASTDKLVIASLSD